MSGVTGALVEWKTTRRKVLALAAAAAAAPFRPTDAKALWPNDAMWVWGERVLVPDPDLPGFADRLRISLLLVYVSPAAADALLSGRGEATENVRAMTANGRRVYAVAGEPEWSRGLAAAPEHAALLVRLVRTTSHFAGLHFDVEPNALPEWSDQLSRSRLADGTLRFYDVIRAVAPGVEIDAATNPIFASMTVRNGNFLRQIAERVNSVSLMAYRNSVKKAIDWAEPAARQIAATRRPWRMGVLVGEGEPGTSWKGASASRFAGAVAELRRLLDQQLPSSCDVGLAFQDYDGLAQIFQFLPEGAPGGP